MAAVGSECPETDAAGFAWLDRLVTSGALYAVDLDQRVVHWSASAASLLGPAEAAIGRRCFEVAASLDPRNAARCRPNCAVVMAARDGRARPDFEVYLPACAGSQKARVSVMLAGGADGEGALVLHVVQPLETDACNHEGPGELRAQLQEAVARVGAPGVQPDTAEGATLTARQRDVLVRLAAGETPREIASSLGVSVVTVRNHVQAAMDRLGAHTRLEAVLAATSAGLL